MATCTTKYCRRESKGKYCYRCQHNHRKERNPYTYWLGVLRRNAARRKKFFGLTLEYWTQWCDDTGYLALKGRRKNDASVDCIINELGYIDGNIEIRTVSDNSNKRTKYVEWDHIKGEWVVIEWAAPAQPETDLPF